MIISLEAAKTNREKLEKFVRSIFKMMTKLSRTIPKYIVKKLYGYCVPKRGNYLKNISRVRWTDHLSRELSEDTDGKVSREEEEANICRFYN